RSDGASPSRERTPVGEKASMCNSKAGDPSRGVPSRRPITRIFIIITEVCTAFAFTALVCVFLATMLLVAVGATLGILGGLLDGFLWLVPLAAWVICAIVELLWLMHTSQLVPLVLRLLDWLCYLGLW